MRAYSNDLRQKVIDAYYSGEGSMRELAKRFKVSLNFVWLLIERHRRTGRVDPKPHGGGQRRKLTPQQERTLVALAKADPVATRAELAQRLQACTGVEVSVSTIGLTLRRRGFTRKRVSYHASEREGDEEIEQARARFRQAQPAMSTARLVFIDESGVNLGLARGYGRALEGARAVAAKPVNTGPNISLIGAVGLDGLRAILEVDGAVDGDVFKAFLEQCLGPQLHPGEEVWMDNLRVHTVEGVVEALEAHQATARYLPPYSPDLSPIEPFWSKLKDWLRGAAVRTRDELHEALRNGLDDIVPSDFRGWFKHCGFCVEAN